MAQPVQPVPQVYAAPVAGAAGTETPTAYCVLRLVIPTKKAGILIGKGGANVKMLFEETGARVKINDLPSNAQDRVVRMIPT